MLAMVRFEMYGLAEAFRSPDIIHFLADGRDYL